MSCRNLPQRCEVPRRLAMLQPSPGEPRQPSLLLALPCSQFGRIRSADIDNRLAEQPEFWPPHFTVSPSMTVSVAQIIIIGNIVIFFRGPNFRYGRWFIACAKRWRIYFRSILHALFHRAALVVPCGQGHLNPHGLRIPLVLCSQVTEKRIGFMIRLAARFVTRGIVCVLRSLKAKNGQRSIQIRS